MTKPMQIALRIFLPILVIFLAFVITRQLILSREKPARAARGEMSVTVQVIPVAPTSRSVVVDAAGTVTAARQIDLRPQVSGRIVAIHPALEPGGLIKTGDVLFEIEERDYELEVARMQAQVEQARFEVTQEEGRGAIAEREWSLLGEEVDATPQGRDLALRIPHLRRAKAALSAAQSALAQAELNLARTKVHAPFEAIVIQESVDLGEVVNPQTVAATLAGTHAYWIRAALPLGDLGFLELPKDPHFSETNRPVARIFHQTAGGVIEKQGQVIRLLGDLEEAGRLARVLIAVADPLGLKSKDGGLPLLLDTFVRVEIQGKRLEGVYALPPEAVREGDRLWVMNGEDRLEIRRTEVVRRRDDEVWVREGLSQGDRLVTTRIGTPIPGMKLRLPSQGLTPEEGFAREVQGE